MTRHVSQLSAAVLIGALLPACTKKEDKSDNDVAPVRVEAIAVSPQPVGSDRAYSGTIEESNGTVLSFSVPGTLRQLYVTDGTRVSQGQLIGTLDAKSLQNAYEIARATLSSAQDAYARMKQLHDANSLPDMKWVEVQNTLRSAEAAAGIAKKSLDDARLYAPYSGVIARKFVDAGATVAPGLPIVKLVKVVPAKVSISVPENEIGRFSTGDKATFTVGAIPGATFSGRLVEKGVAADPLSRAYSVKFEFDNSDGRLLPGMICNLAIDTPQSSDKEVITLPNGTVLLSDDNRSFVWVITDGRAHRRFVSIPKFTATGVIVGSGLQAGDSVIVTGHQKVSENSIVDPITR